jgi:hypothetical protein
MTSPKPQRGRPLGSGKDDSRALALIADYLVRDSSLKPTTAMKRVMLSGKGWGATDATLLRRWQVKWKQHGETLLATARERAKPKAEPGSYPGRYEYYAGSLLRQPSAIEAALEYQRRLEAMFKPSLAESLQRAMRQQEDFLRSMRVHEEMLRSFKIHEEFHRAFQASRIFDPFGSR